LKRLRAAAFRVLRLSLIPTLLRMGVQRRRVTILVYHDPSPALFRRHVPELAKRYSIIMLGELVDALYAGTFEELPPRALVITFDDGHRRNHDLAEILRQHDVRASLFICAEIVDTKRGFWFKHAADLERLKRSSDAERLELLDAWGFKEEEDLADREALSAEELRDLDGVFELQSHTLTHPILSRCSDEKAWDEISKSAPILKARFGIDADGFAYPNGDFTKREVAYVKQAGYRYAVSMGYGFVSADTDLYRLPRIPIHDTDDVDELLVKASGCWRPFAAFKERRRKSRAYPAVPEPA
jgi:peptidoglycan/xylan/chitin deacetylase (PgdA/CDA1 family)